MVKFFKIVGITWIAFVVSSGFVWGALAIFVDLPGMFGFLADFGGIYFLALIAAPGILLVRLGSTLSDPVTD